MKKLLMLAMVAFALVSCSKTFSPATLKESKWVLTSWPGNVLPADAKATLNFSTDNKISGKSFCNNYGGSSVINGNAMQFSKLFSTKMACQNLGNVEYKYSTELVKVDAGKVNGNKLYLYNGETLLMVFTKEK